MKVLLHVGCGSSDIRHLPAYFQDGSWNELRYDINEAVEPDLVGTLQDMSMIEDGTIDAIYSSHNIEHVWSFEVPQVLSEFMRVLKPDGFAVVLCPDILSVAQAITKGFLGQTLYTSPAGPISAIDIMYGFQQDIEKGNLFMAHKTAFTAQTLASALSAGGFAGSVIARDRCFGLYSLATRSCWDEVSIKHLIDALQPVEEYVLERMRFGCYSPSV